MAAIRVGWRRHGVIKTRLHAIGYYGSADYRPPSIGNVGPDPDYDLFRSRYAPPISDLDTNRAY